MNILEYLYNLGIVAWIKPNGKLGVKGLSGLDVRTCNQLVEWISQHKHEIVSELAGEISEKREKSRQLWAEPSKKERKKGRKKVTSRMMWAWKTARPWLLDHLPELESKGWTRKQLFRADRHSYPHGPWGPAWSSNWLRQNVRVNIEADGAIRWTWTERTGAEISQTARPPP